MGFKNMKLLLIISLLLRSEADSSYSHRPMDLMADLTNDLGMCILQIQSALQHGNTAFSPYGVASMSVLLFEGATGNTAIEIMKVLNLPWNTLLVRIGFRDINRHLKTYFRSDGFLRGLIMSRDDVCFHPSYQKMLRVYGFEEPDKALTYPCNGFTPYATSTTTVSSTSEEAVTVTSPSSNETTTGPTTTVESSTPTVPQTEETENVVTEMTQTSQTLTIVNSTTFTPIEAEAVNEAITSIKTELPSTLFGGTESSAGLATITTNTIPDTHMALSAGQTTVFASTDRVTKGNTTSSTEPAVLLTAANTIMENKFPPTTPQKNSAIRTERTTMAGIKATTSKMQQLQNSTIPQKNVTMSGVRNQTNTSNVAAKGPKNGTKDELSDFNLNNLDVKNFTIKLDSDFGFSTTDSSIFDNFFNKTNELNIGPNSSLLSNISSISIFPTTSSFSNLSTIFSGAKPTLDKELDIKNATSFYSTLVNFIENTTEKIKNLLGSKDNSTSNPQNMTNNISNVSTVLPNDQNAKPNQNSTAREEKMMKNNSQPTLLSAEKNSINADKGMAETNDTRNLPKKSISQNNQMPKSAAISISPSAFRSVPNYYNIVSLKQSKSISSTYDIKGIKKAKRHRMKREAQTKDANQLNAKQTHESSKLTDLPKEGNVLPYNQWALKKAPTMNIWQFDNNNKSVVETKFHHYTANEKGRNDFYGSLKAGNNHNSDYRNNYGPEYRKAPSLNHRYFLPPGTDWFTTHGQNIRIPVFSYSAILPFAYIEDLKSKVLEIPLDDQNYQLLILLPSPDYGMEYLINSLTGYSLRKIRAHLRDTAVFATIPKFSVVSHINLRQALYYLGIRDVFHRYRADLSIMSPDARLFVQSIEQVVTIHVDKFPNTAYPVPEPLTDRYFLASHPFLYFVIDKESGVNLVAGIMNDPLKQTTRFL